MMEKWKRVLAIFLMFVIAFTLGACGTTPEQSQGTTPGETSGTGTQETTAEESPQTVDKAVWFSDVSFWPPPTRWTLEEDTVMGAITAATGLEFEMNIPAEDGSTALALMLVSGSLPDVMSITDNTLIPQLVESGKLWRLDELLETFDPDSHLLHGGYPDDVKRLQIERDGGWYAYASHMNSPDMREIFPPSDDYYLFAQAYNENLGLRWNDQLLEEFGLTLDDLWTEEQVLNALEIAKNSTHTVNGARVIPLLVDGTSYQDFSLRPLQYFFGAMPIDDNGIYRNWILAPESKHALRFLNTAMRNGYIDPLHLTIDISAMQTYMQSGRVLCFIGNTANIGITDPWTLSGGGILSSEGTVPALPKNLGGSTGWISTFISKDTPYPEKIAKWMTFMSSKDGLYVTCYGFEGIDYVLNDDGITLTQTEDGLAKTNDFTNSGVIAWWPFHNTSFFEHVLPAPAEDSDDYQNMIKNTAIWRKDETVIWNSALINIPETVIDANSDLGNSRSQIRSYLAAQITAVVMAGSESAFEAEYDAMIAQLERLGLQDVDAVYHEAYMERSEFFGEALTNANSGR